MKFKEAILARFSGEGSGAPFYLPDLTLWYAWHQSRGTLPEDWQDYSLPQVARALSVPVWMAITPFRVETPGVENTTTEQGGERVVRVETSAGSLVARWSEGPDGDWWQVEYPVKSADDLDAVLEVVKARTYVVDAARLDHWQAAVGDDGLVALELPRRPYSDLLHDYLGWSEGLLFLRDPRIDEINAVLETKLQGLVEDLSDVAGDLVLSPDNLDGQFISPRAFRTYLADSYRHTADALHKQGKRLVVHVGGPVKRLFGPLVEAGVDGFEGIAGPPQSDLTLNQARESAGPGATLWGGIPQDLLLPTHEWQEFELAITQTVQDVRGDNRMLLGVADRVPVNADLTRLAAIPGLVENANSD